MKKLFVSAFFLVSISLASPLSARADDALVQANVNVRHQGSLVWTGSVSLAQASSTALDALKAADESSADFTISDLQYYADYGSYFVNCLSINALSAPACGNWQYVVNSAYPPVGMDKYAVASGDTLYFYYGTPRRAFLTSSSAEASTSVSVLTQTYDYTNDTWKPLAGIEIGATQPNPNDPYSPLVLFRTTSADDGVARLLITTPGTYSVGIASDYYYPAETLTITEAQAQAAAETAHVPREESHTSSLTPQNDQPVQAPALATSTLVASPTEAVEALIQLDIPIDEFIKNWWVSFLAYLNR